MRPDPVAEEFFSEQREDPANGFCFDCGTAEPQWASVSHGIYLSIAASGVHRSLGVGVSFVQSTTLDAWKPVHLRMMQLGGNKRFRDFLEEHRVPEDMPVREKYRTQAAEWYRRNLRALAEGTTPPAPLPAGVGCWPVSGLDSPTGEVLDRVFRSPSGPALLQGRAAPRTIQGLQPYSRPDNKRRFVGPADGNESRAAMLRVRSSSPGKAGCRAAVAAATGTASARSSRSVADLVPAGRGNGTLRPLNSLGMPEATCVQAAAAAAKCRDLASAVLFEAARGQKRPPATFASGGRLSEQLAALTAGHRTAERLRRMSTGTMEGFDSSGQRPIMEVQAAVAA